MNEADRTRISKFLSLVLRHRPDAVGLSLDAHGFAPIDELLTRCREKGRPIEHQELVEVVETSPKRRFAISEDGLSIRASQGHSVQVDLAYDATEPPEVLFHGTAVSRLQAIRAEGLRKMRRHHVHLSDDSQTARAVGRRRGDAVVLAIAAGRMFLDGHAFYRSANGVWLTECVPPTYVGFPPGLTRGSVAKPR